MKVFSEEIEEGEIKVTASLLEVENAVIAFFDEKGSMKLGTFAIAIPQYGGRRCISSVLLGERNVLITKILAEQLVKTFNKIALVSTHLAEIKESRTGSILVRLAQKLGEKTKLEGLP